MQQAFVSVVLYDTFRLMDWFASGSVSSLHPEYNDVTSITLALHTLGSFDFEGKSLSARTTSFIWTWLVAS